MAFRLQHWLHSRYAGSQALQQSEALSIASYLVELGLHHPGPVWSLWGPRMHIFVATYVVRQASTHASIVYSHRTLSCCPLVLSMLIGASGASSLCGASGASLSSLRSLRYVQCASLRASCTICDAGESTSHTASIAHVGYCVRCTLTSDPFLTPFCLVSAFRSIGASLLSGASGASSCML